MSETMYGVSQYYHGSEKVWIFDEKGLLQRFSPEMIDIIKEEIKKSGTFCEDIHWPIGGSNSSATFIERLDSMEDARKFLVERCDGPDLEDPMLIDLAEYYRSVEVDEGSITQDILDYFNLKAEDLERTDDRIEELLSLGYTNADFYGDKRNVRYSEAVA